MCDPYEAAWSDVVADAVLGELAGEAEAEFDDVPD